MTEIIQKIKIIFLDLLRWKKPTGRLLILIPALWSLCLSSDKYPDFFITLKIILGALLVSGLACVSNDIWDKDIDKKVERTKNRPLPSENLNVTTAYIILFILILFSFLLTLTLPKNNRILSIKLSFIVLILILIYPSTKRWFVIPQLILSLCLGFTILIPWSIIQGNLNSYVLLYCWLATIFWTFGFDTIYSLLDINDDRKIEINSSSIFLGDNVKKTIQICYLLTYIFLGFSAIKKKLYYTFWPIWIVTLIMVQKDVLKLFKNDSENKNKYLRHFQNQVIYGGLILLAIIISS